MELENNSTQIREIEQEILLLNKISKDIDALIFNQRELIDNLQSNILTTREAIHSSEQELQTANTHLNHTTFMYAGLGSLAGGLVSIVLAPIVTPLIPIVGGAVWGIVKARN